MGDEEDETVRHQFTAQAFLLSEENNWDAVSNGHVLVFQLLCDSKSIDYRLVAWDTQDNEKVALNVNLCRKSEFKIDQERFSYVSVPGETAVGQLLGMSFRSEQENRTTMGAIAQGIEHMREEKERETKDGGTAVVATRLSAGDSIADNGELSGGGTTSRTKDEEDEEESTKFSRDIEPLEDVSQLTKHLQLKQFLQYTECQMLQESLVEIGCESIQDLMQLKPRDFDDFDDVSSVKIMISVISALKPYVTELLNEGEDVGETILDDEVILATVSGIAKKHRDALSGETSPKRPPRPASRPDMFVTEERRSARRNSSIVTGAAMRAAESRKRRSGKQSDDEDDVERRDSRDSANLHSPGKLRVEALKSGDVRPRSDSHSPYIRASNMQTPAHGHGVDEDGISRVYNLQRKVHVKYNVSKARFDHVPVGLELQFNRQFGVPLKQCPAVRVDGYDEKIPAVLVMMKNELFRCGGLKTEGIFRLAPEKAACAMAKKEINHGEFDGCDDVNIMANLIKVWFRELPEKLLNAVPTSAIEHTARVGEAGAGALVSATREPERSLLLWLLDMAADIVKHKRKNRMDSRNMAIVLSPNLYQPTEEEPMAAMSRMSKVVQSVTALLKWRIDTHRKSVTDL